MFDKFRFDTVGFIFLSFVTLQGCSQRPPVNPAILPIGPAMPALAQFSLNTPVDKIAADRGGNAVLKRDVPGLLTNRSYPLFNDMSLLQIASLSCGRLTKAKLDQVQADLTQLSN
jgi:hypothetical protein